VQHGLLDLRQSFVLAIVDAERRRGAEAMPPARRDCCFVQDADGKSLLTAGVICRQADRASSAIFV